MFDSWTVSTNDYNVYMRTQVKLREKIKSEKVIWNIERNRKTGTYDPTTAVSIKTSLKKKNGMKWRVASYGG